MGKEEMSRPYNMKCPVCGKTVHEVKPPNLSEKYFAFVIHSSSYIVGHKQNIKEDRGCYLTKDQFMQMTEVPVEADPD